jgi:hypothetical protein
MKFKYVVIVLSLVGLSVLYLVSGLSQPTIISLSLVPFNEGKQVVVKGVVTQYQTTTYGSSLITIRDVNSTRFCTITLYLEGDVSVEYGDLIQATGVVQQYNSNWEITISNPRFIEILQPWGNRSFPVWQLAQNPTKYVDTNVNVSGIVGALSNTSFSLRDTEGTSVVPVSCADTSGFSFSPGAVVAVSARFLYNQETLSYFLQLIDSTHGVVVMEEE